MADVPAHQGGRPHLVDGPAKARRQGGGQGAAAFPEKGGQDLGLPPPQASHQKPHFLHPPPGPREDEGGDEGKGQDGLRQNHGVRGVEEAQRAQGPRAGEEEVEEEAHHD